MKKKKHSFKTTRTIGILLLSVFAVLMFVMAVTHNSTLGYIAIAVLGIYGIFLLAFWRCPNCNENLGPIWIKHCPNCGEKIS